MLSATGIDQHATAAKTFDRVLTQDARNPLGGVRVFTAQSRAQHDFGGPTGPRRSG